MTNRNLELKISLQNLRNAIDIEKSLWINTYSTNCYAYALGLDIPQYEIKDYAYAPGVIANSDIFLPSFRIFNYEDLINNIYLDLEALDIQFREISPLDDVNSNEWKIALFITKTDDGIEDYHFLRQHSDGFWHHKKGFGGMVSKYDCYGQIIENPEECDLGNRKYDKCLSLKLK